MLDEAIERAARVVEEKSPDMPDEEKKRVAEVVGIGAVKFAELSQNRMTDYVFNWDKMLALQGDTAPYLQNSYVRVRSIFRKLDGGPLDWSAPIQLSEDAEIHLARLLARYGKWCRRCWTTAVRTCWPPTCLTWPGLSIPSMRRARS